MLTINEAFLHSSVDCKPWLCEGRFRAHKGQPSLPIILHVIIQSCVSVEDKSLVYVPHNSDLGAWTDRFGLFSLFDLVSLPVAPHLRPCPNPTSPSSLFSTHLLPFSSLHSGAKVFLLTLKDEVNTWKDLWPFNKNVSVGVVVGDSQTSPDFTTLHLHYMCCDSFEMSLF